MTDNIRLWDNLLNDTLNQLGAEYLDVADFGRVESEMQRHKIFGRIVPFDDREIDGIQGYSCYIYRAIHAFLVEHKKFLPKLEINFFLIDTVPECNGHMPR